MARFNFVTTAIEFLVHPFHQPCRGLPSLFDLLPVLGGSINRCKLSASGRAGHRACTGHEDEVYTRRRRSRTPHARGRPAGRRSPRSSPGQGDRRAWCCSAAGSPATAPSGPPMLSTDRRQRAADAGDGGHGHEQDQHVHAVQGCRMVRVVLSWPLAGARPEHVPSGRGSFV